MRALFGLCLLCLFCFVSTLFSQESSKPSSPPEEVVRVSTRVVFVDVSVKDEETNAPARDLSPENFQVYDDGRLRKLSYFSREGDTRRPLSLLIFIDLWSMYGRKYIREPSAMTRLADVLQQRLAPEDQVAVMTTWIEKGVEPRRPQPLLKTVSDFTTDRNETRRALTEIPKLVAEQEDLLEKISKDARLEKWEIEVEWSLAEVAATIMRDDAARRSRQFIVVGLIDDLFALRRGERQLVAEAAAHASITFYGLVYNKSFMGKLFLGTVNQIFMRPSGKSLHAADYLAEQTGGLTQKVGKFDDLTSGLEKIISDVASRYSLGFTLEDDERPDNRMRQLEVRVEARDARGKNRKLKTRFRQGYFVPQGGQ